MADPIFGPKSGPQNGVQNWILFEFLLMSLRLGPVLGSRFGPKSGVSHRRILLLTAEVLQADLRRSSMSMSMSVGLTHAFFSLSVPTCCLLSKKLTEEKPHLLFTCWRGVVPASPHPSTVRRCVVIATRGCFVGFYFSVQRLLAFAFALVLVLFVFVFLFVFWVFFCLCFGLLCFVLCSGWSW